MRRRLTEPLASRPRTLRVTRLGSGLRVPRASRSGHPAAWRASSDVMGFTMRRALTRIGNRSALLVVFEAQARSRAIWLEAARVYSGSVMPAAEYGGLAHRGDRLCRWTARSRLEMSKPLPVPNASGIWPGASSQCVERAAAEIGKEIDIRVGRRPSRIVGHKRATRDRDRLPATVGEDRLDEARVRRAALCAAGQGPPRTFHPKSAPACAASISAFPTSSMNMRCGPVMSRMQSRRCGRDCVARGKNLLTDRPFGRDDAAGRRLVGWGCWYGGV